MNQQPILQQPSAVLPLGWFTAFTLFFILLLTVSTARASEVWQPLGGAGFSAGTANYTSLAIHPSDGKPYVAYKDGGNGNKATVMRLNAAGTAWENVGNPGFSAGGANDISLVINPIDGKPYVAYGDGGNGNKATVMRLDATDTAWENVGNPGFSADFASFTSLAINPSDGKPYVAYEDWGAGYKATVMRLDAAGTAWENVGNAGFSAGFADYTSLAISPDGKPYVAYRDHGNGFKATVMRLNAAGSAWEIVGNAGFSAGEALYTSLAINPIDGKPYVAYKDGGNGDKATVMRLDAGGTAWEIVGNAGFSAGEALYTSLAINPIDGKPYVAYQDGNNGDKATVMRLNAAGMAWEIVGNAGFSAGLADYTSLAINPSDGKPYVAYQDRNNSDKATVMRLITAPNAPAAQAIPTLGEWALAVLAFAMAGLAFLTRKRIQRKWAA